MQTYLARNLERAVILRSTSYCRQNILMAASGAGNRTTAQWVIYHTRSVRAKVLKLQMGYCRQAHAVSRISSGHMGGAYCE